MITLNPKLPPVPAIDASQTTSARKLEWPSEVPPSEPQGQCERSRPVTGSLPVLSAEALIEKWSNAAHACNQRAEAMTRNGGFGASALSAQEIEAQRIYRICAKDLRREMEAATVRQPEENTQEVAGEALPPSVG